MQKSHKQTLNDYLKWSLLSVIIGVLSGVASAVFLFALNWATDYRNQHMWLIWFLPLAGLAIAFIYYKYGKDSQRGTGLIIEEIHDPKNILPLRMAPFIFLGTLVTHLFGGSAGREGTAVQMGSTLADQLSRFFKITNEERKILLIAGAGAGFSACIGAPLAGALFGLEVIQIGKIRAFALFECLVASFVGYYICILIGAPHSQFPVLEMVSYNWPTLGAVLLASLVFGAAANIFVQFTHFIEFLQKKFIRVKFLRPFFAGSVLLILYYFEGSYRYAGLGIPEIQNSFSQASFWYTPFYKMIVTALTVGSGFKGGEFIPLVFIGTTLGSFLSTQMLVSQALLASLGFAAVFGAAANTPIACAILACELFGWSLAPYAFLSCWIAYFMTGHTGIYKNQRTVYSKKDQLLKLIKVFKRN